MSNNLIFPVKLHLRIDWSEMDLFGHVNNVMFMKYVQASRVNYWEHIGLTRHHSETGLGPMLLSTACQFRKPLYYPGNIVIESRMEYIRNTSFSIHHRILDADNDIAAEAQDVMVMFDFNKHEKALFPAVLREAAIKLEGRDL